MKRLLLATLVSVVFLIVTIGAGCFYSPSPSRQEPAKPQRGPVNYIGPDLDGSDGALRGRDYRGAFNRDSEDSETDDSSESATDEYEYIYESIRPMEPVIEEEPAEEEEPADTVPIPEPRTSEGFSL